MTTHADSELSEIHRTLAAPSPEFDAWVASMDKKLWARFDLSAARLGWEAAKAQGNPPMTAPADSRISDDRLTELLVDLSPNNVMRRKDLEGILSALTELRERRAQAVTEETAKLANAIFQDQRLTLCLYGATIEEAEVDAMKAALEGVFAVTPPPAQAAGVTEAAKALLAAIDASDLDIKRHTYPSVVERAGALRQALSTQDREE